MNLLDNINSFLRESSTKFPIYHKTVEHHYDNISKINILEKKLKEMYYLYQKMIILNV